MKRTLLLASVACALFLCCFAGTGCSVKMLDKWQTPDFSYASARSGGLAVGGVVFSLSAGGLKEDEMPAYATMLAEQFSRSKDNFSVLPWNSLGATMDSTRLSSLLLHYSSGTKLTGKELEKFGDGSGKARYLVFGYLDSFENTHKRTTDHEHNPATDSQRDVEVWTTTCQAIMLGEIYDLQNGTLAWQAKVKFKHKNSNTYEEKHKSLGEVIADAIFNTGKREYPADYQVHLVVKLLLGNLGTEFRKS